MDERARRLWAGTEAGAIGWGGVAAVARATGMAISTVRKGRDEARAGATAQDVVKVRRSAGKRPYEVAHPEVWPALEKLVDPTDARRPGVAAAVDVQEHARAVRRAVRAARHPAQRQDGGQAAARPRLQPAGAEQVRRRASSIPIATRSSSTSTRRRRTASSAACRSSPSTPRRRSWSATSRTADASGNPGRARAGGRPRLPVRRGRQGDPVRRLRPRRQRRLRERRRRSRHAGVRGRPRSRRGGSRSAQSRYPEAREIFITADAGGSNSYRSRRVEAPSCNALADKLDMAIHVSHFPPGTSKWNKIEHRLFSFISINWRGRPLRTYETVINLIGNTTNRGGLVVRARLDRRRYPDRQEDLGEGTATR